MFKLISKDGGTLIDTERTKNSSTPTQNRLVSAIFILAAKRQWQKFFGTVNQVNLYKTLKMKNRKCRGELLTQFRMYGRLNVMDAWKEGIPSFWGTASFKF